jgi:hypothetical protein
MTPLAEGDSSIVERWRAHLGPDVFGQPILLVPYRHSDRGWFDWNPVQAYDASARRPGLPPDVAALVSSIDPVATVVTLVNLAGVESRAVVVQAGAFGQHEFMSVSYDGAEPGWAGSDTEYISRDVRITSATAEVGGPWLEVRLPAGTQVTLTLRLRTGARLPSLRTPWSPG